MKKSILFLLLLFSPLCFAQDGCQELMMGSGGTGCSYSTAYNVNLSTAYNYGVNRTLRQVIPANTSSYNGTKVKITFQNASASDSAITAASICVAGTSPSCSAGTLVQVYVSASPGFTVPAGGTVTSDEVTINFDKTQSYILTAQSGSNQFYIGAATSQPGYTIWYQASIAQALIETVSGYSFSANEIDFFSKLEVCH